MRALLRAACALGWHHYTWQYVGNADAPTAHVRACTRCGAEP